MRKSHILSLVAAPTLALALPLLTPGTAQACGGTFCDNSPGSTAMPVDQTGENILFHIGENSVEAHINIQIDDSTEADAFAWVIPVMALPEFEVGSQLLFDNMLAGSVPTYGRTFTSDQCAPPPDDQNGTGAASTGFGDEGGETGGDGGGPEGPNVVFSGSVGAYEIAVLDGGTVEGVMQWLAENDYEQDPAAEPILAEYLANDFLFVALKLTVEAGVEDVHPIVIRYEGTEPCVPITLTRIASVDDMDLRTFFLGDARVVPVNYRHVLVNELKIDWFSDGSNYKEVISMAVDAQEADGNAFVTEYAGASDVVSLAGVWNAAWDAGAYLDYADSPVGVMQEIFSDNLMFCEIDWDYVCTPLHPLLQPILDQYLPVPDGVDPVDFYTNLGQYVDQLDPAVWDATAFAQLLDERIFKPGQRAKELVEANPYLTRMYTTISPPEMNADPIFRTNSSLPDVDNIRQATQRTLCDGSVLMTLPSGREIFFPADEDLVWPEFQDEMPWDEDIEEANMADDAPLINLVDNTEKIDTLLDEYNKSKGYGDIPDGCSCSSEQGGAAGSVAFGLLALGLFGFVRRKRD